MKPIKVPANGRVTIPKDLRKKFNLNTGTKVAFIEMDGFILIQTLNKKYFDEVAGSLGLKGKHLKSLMTENKREREF